MIKERIKRLINTNKYFSLHADTILYILRQMFEYDTFPSTVFIVIENTSNREEIDLTRYVFHKHSDNFSVYSILQ